MILFATHSALLLSALQVLVVQITMIHILLRFFYLLKTSMFIALHHLFLSILHRRELLIHGIFFFIWFFGNWRNLKKDTLSSISSYTSTERIKTAFQAKCTIINLQMYSIWMLIAACRIQKDQHLSLIPIYIHAEDQTWL